MFTNQSIKISPQKNTIMKIRFLFITLLWFSSLAKSQVNIVDSLTHQTYQRKYAMHFPPNFTNTDLVPILFMLHGGGGTMLNAQNFTNLNQVSNANGFIAVYPEGYGVIPSGGFSWADGRGTSADIAGIDDLGFINKLLDTLMANYTIDTNKIYICGFSNGGFMIQRLACEQNQRFAAMASLGSIMDTILFSNCNPQRAIPMMFVLGTEDPFVPFNGGAMIGSGLVTDIVGADILINFWKTNNNCLLSNLPINLPDIDQSDSSTVTLFNYSNCSCNSDVMFYKVNGGGHTWPGVEITLYEIIAGQTNEDFQASEELWNFFNTHTLCTTPVGFGTSELSKTISFYPNPTNEFINVDSKNGFQIYNSTGKLVLHENLPTSQINITAFPSGLYILKIDNKMGRFIKSE
jgi:polyhydroxybutyrate depolymerase